MYAPADGGEAQFAQGGAKIYRALLTQANTQAPVAIVFENTIGDVSWARDDVGYYIGTLVNAFPEERTMVFIGTIAGLGMIAASNSSSNSVDVITADNTGTNTDGLLLKTAIEIFVYPE
jgi:hypothetical protein